MTNTPDSAPGPAGGPAAIRDAAGGPDDETDLLSPEWSRPAAPAWLLVTAADGAAGQAFTALRVTGPSPCAHGGDVLLRVSPGDGRDPGPAVSVTAWAVAAGSLVPVASWELPDDGSWPERVRATVIFAMSAVSALEEHADVGALEAVDLDAAAATAEPGLPPLPGTHGPAVIG